MSDLEHSASDLTDGSRSSREWEQVHLAVPVSSERKSPGPRLLSPLVVYRNLRAGASFSNLLQLDDMMATTTIPPPDARSPAPSARQTLLGFMGRRARSATTGTPPTTNPSPPLASPALPQPSLGLSGVEHHHHLHVPALHRHSPATADAQPEAPPASGSGRLGGILRRRRSGGGDTSPNENPTAPLDSTNRSASVQPRTAQSGSTQAPTAQRSASSAIPRETTSAGNGPVHRLRLVPHLDPLVRTLHFDPIIRDVHAGGSVLRIGRFTDRSGVAAPKQSESTKIAFRSKVVSRAHAEIWCAPNGKFLIRDTRSSSGTFLNHTRLSAPNVESRPQELHDGDIIQLGVDYQGGTEEIYRCVKIRVEIGREWQREANEFNTGALKQLQTLQGKDKGRASSSSAIAGPSNSRKTSVADCCICLFPVAILQSLFIAPCSHCFHYKCIRPLLIQHHPGFSCPLCRTFADLEEDVEKEYAPSVYAPSVYSPSVHESEGVAAIIGNLAGHEAGASGSGSIFRPSPAARAKDLPAVPAGYAASGSGSGGGPTTPSGSSRQLEDDTLTDGPARAEMAIHSDGGSTPRGSSEDLRAAQRGMGESGARAAPIAIAAPRTPEREREILNSATPLNHQFLTLTALPAGLPSIPSVGDIQALRRGSDYSSSVNLAAEPAPRETYGDGESARYLLLDGEDDGDDEDDDEMVVINGMKRLSVQTQTGAAGPSRARELGKAKAVGGEEENTPVAA